MAARGENPTVLCELSSGYAVIGDVQFLPGCCVLLGKNPAAHALADLSRRERGAVLMAKPVWLYDSKNWRDPETALASSHDALRARITAELSQLSKADVVRIEEHKRGVDR